MRRTHIIMIIILGLLLAILFVGKSEDNKKIVKNITQETALLLPNIDTTTVESITLTRNRDKNSVTLKKINGEWIVSQFNYPADKSAVTGLLETLKTIRKGRKLGEATDEMRKKFNIETAGTTVSLGKTTFAMGKAADGSFTPIVIDNILYASPLRTPWKIAKTDNEWRERKLFPKFKKEDVTKVTFGDTKEELSTEKRDKLLTEIANLSISLFPTKEIETVDFTKKTVNKKTTKEPIKKATLSLSSKSGATTTLELTGLKTEEGDNYIVSKDGVSFGILFYHYNKILELLNK